MVICIPRYVFLHSGRLWKPVYNLKYDCSLNGSVWPDMKTVTGTWQFFEYELNSV